MLSNVCSSSGHLSRRMNGGNLMWMDYNKLLHFILFGGALSFSGQDANIIKDYNDDYYTMIL